MIGISTLSSRPFPASLLRRTLQAAGPWEPAAGRRRPPSRRHTGGPPRGPWPDECSTGRRLPATGCYRLVMARDGFDGRNHLLVGHLVGGAHEAGGPPVHEDGAIA